MEGPDSPTTTVIKNVRRIRRARGLTAEQLAERLTDLGMKIGRVGVVKLEGGNRSSMSIDEVFAFAVALNVSPLSLVTPGNLDVAIAVTPTTTASGRVVSLWAAGDKPLENEGVDAWLDWVRELPAWKKLSAADQLEALTNTVLDPRFYAAIKDEAKTRNRPDIVKLVDAVRAATGVDEPVVSNRASMPIGGFSDEDPVVGDQSQPSRRRRRRASDETIGGSSGKFES